MNRNLIPHVETIVLKKTDFNENQKMEEMEEGSSENANTEDKFRKTYSYWPREKKTCRQKCSKSCTCNPGRFFINLFPILGWLPKYKWKSDLYKDIIAGITVAVMHIPQGLAYSLLAGVTPVVGLYMSVFPVFIYVLMGTSRHISTGSFAVLCMMVGKTVFTYTHVPIWSGGKNYTDVEVASATAFMVGLWQILLGVLRLGILTVLFSEVLVSGFTTGVAIHVMSSQVKSLLGASVKSFHGPFKLVFMYYDLFANITSCNLVTIGMSASFFVFVIVLNEVLKPRLMKRCPIPLPVELIAIITGALLSFFLSLKDYDVNTIGFIPTGFPVPAVPPLDLMPKILLDSFVVAVVACAMNLSLCKVYARKHEYDIRPNQELLAYGCGNFFSSFFFCLPFASSLSRTAIQTAAGSVTQLTSLFSCFLLVFVLLFAGPLFDPVPDCVLSVIIVVALKGMLFQIAQFRGIYRLSKIDGLIWAATFLSVVFLSIELGIAIGILVVLATMLIRGQVPKLSVIGRVPDTDTYLDMTSFKAAVAIPNVTILRPVGFISFANCDKLREDVLSKLTKDSVVLDNDHTKPAVILDLISVSFIDPAGVKSISFLYNKLKSSDTDLFLCNCNVDVYNTMKHCKLFDSLPSSNVFPYLHDAVTFTNKTVEDGPS